MTTPWAITNIWEGQTVAVLGAGPSLTAEKIDALKLSVDRCIVVNYVYRQVLWADLVVALDVGPDFWAEVKSVDMMKIVGMECDIDAFYIGHRWEEVTIGPNHVIHVLNSGLLAIRLAYLLGAKKIVLCGFDPTKFEHCPGYPGECWRPGTDEPFPGVAAGLASMVAEFRSKGIEVVQV